MEEVLGNQTQTTKYIFPEFPKNLPGTFWGLTCFFNPQQYKNKKENYLKFRESNKKQGLKLICVELAFNDNPYELTNNDADILIQIRTASVLWQKERLLNIAFKSLPQDCDKIAWLDCDILFEDDSWIKLASEKLEKYAVVQLFENALFLEKDLKKENAGHFISFVKNVETSGLDEFYKKNNYPGFAWAARREIFENRGFYDKAIIGAGDGIMALSFINSVSMAIPDFYYRKIRFCILSWAKEIYPLVKNSVNYLPLTIIHLYHGEKKNRAYKKRDYILSYFKFDSDNDIKINEDGVWTWNSNKKFLHQAVYDYFFSRNEENVKNTKLSPLLRFLYSLEVLKFYFFRMFGLFGVIIKKRSLITYLFLKKCIAGKN